ncbi:hypothetical protein LOK49_LG08G02570 [Camellia lanceoleosa]|uniref:Uncharacterized protein n=1 Tax=Camellia lanceoleosa TaxID=1840588 RepID=A0ACC0GPW6_9ERIC|nr:hypothetical protein LOK49_LG08G02570 [Camellia lanceoleosa]
MSMAGQEVASQYSILYKIIDTVSFVNQSERLHCNVVCSQYGMDGFSISVAVSRTPSLALTEENRLFLEAWRTIDRAYVDKNFNGQSWFRYRENALRNEPMNTREETCTLSELLSHVFSSGVCMHPRISDKTLYIIKVRPQGPEGSAVELTIQSGPEIKHLSLARERVSLNPVQSTLCEITGSGGEDSKVGYIKLTSFNQNASGAVREAIETLRRNNVNAFVLDLRDNSGGLFPEGIEIAKIWLEKGVIVYICDSQGVRDIYDTDGSNAIAAREPLAVLVNKGTASASEILAGALKDNKRAVLFGEPTYGKGKIQSVFELSDGSGLAVTVARYETPAHTDIDKVSLSLSRSLSLHACLNAHNGEKPLGEFFRGGTSGEARHSALVTAYNKIYASFFIISPDLSTKHDQMRRRKLLTKPQRGSEKMKANEKDQGSTNAMYLDNLTDSDSDSDSADDVDEVTLARMRAILVILLMTNYV